MFYFRGVAIFGFMCAFGLAYFILGRSFARSLTTYLWSIPILTGISVSYFVAWRLDAKHFKDGNFDAQSSLKKILFSSVIYYSGAFVGCFSNYLLNGVFLNSSSSHLNEFKSWFGKPIFFLTAMGIPVSILVGIIFLVFFKLIFAGKRTAL